MDIGDFTRRLYLLPLTPIVVVAALSVAYWLFMAGKFLRITVLRIMVQHAGRVFGRRSVDRWLTDSENLSMFQ